MISRLRFYFSVSVLLVAFCSEADELQPDSVATGMPPMEVLPAISEDEPSGAAVSPTLPSVGLPTIPLWSDGLQLNPLATSIPSQSFLPGTAMLGMWGSGGIYATGQSVNLIGLGAIERGSLNLSHNFGNFSVTLFGEAEKYGYFSGLSTVYGFGGAVSYTINSNLSLTLFGSYHTSSGIVQPALAGYVSTPQFGGFLDWKFHDKWGVKVGAKSYRSIAYGRWETQPIVMPYYRTSSGATIGVDVGGILYQLVRSVSVGRGGNHTNPTIAPVIDSPFTNSMP